MKTNSKEVKAAMQAHLLDCIDTRDFNQHDGSLKTSLQIICEEFKRVAIYPYNLKHFKTYQACFIDWLQGLPSCFEVEFTNHGILEKMKSFGLPLPTNKDESQGIDLYHYLVFREFLSLCKSNKVDFWAIVQKTETAIL